MVVGGCLFGVGEGDAVDIKVGSVWFQMPVTVLGTFWVDGFLSHCGVGGGFQQFRFASLVGGAETLIQRLLRYGWGRRHTATFSFKF